MRASLDTNAIIHFYRAEKQQILFDFFADGLFIYEQIRNVELNNHGKCILDRFDSDIAAGRVHLFGGRNQEDRRKDKAPGQDMPDADHYYAPA